MSVPIPGKIRFMKSMSAQEPQLRCLPTFSIVSVVIWPIFPQHPSFAGLLKRMLYLSDKDRLHSSIDCSLCMERSV